MKRLDSIQYLYKPLQPSVRSNQNINYIEVKPSNTLTPFVYCYWQLKSKQKLSESFLYKVVADGCIDIFFEVSQPSQSSVMGFCRNYVAFDLGPSFNYVGVRFLPTMFPHIFKTNAHDLLNRVVDLKDIDIATSEFIINKISYDTPFKNIVAEFDKYFARILASKQFDIDARLYDAIQIIYDKKGRVNLSKDFNTGISPRQLRRLFQYYIGDTAKAFSKVVQFQHTLASIRNWDHLKSDRIYLECGYYDQAHFIKDFKNFYGVTPSVAFG